MGKLLETFQIYRNLGNINSLSDDGAEELFRSISGSSVWASEMSKQRPFPMLDALFRSADGIWLSLPPAEWTHAFEKLGEENYGRPDGAMSEDLVEALSLYKAKFRFIFVLDTSEKDAAEVLAVCRARLGNSARTELKIAAEEHRKIIESRLTGILEQ